MSLPWVRLDSRICTAPDLSNVRHERGGDRAAFVFLACLVWTKTFEQDGHVPRGLPRMYGGTKRDADLLVLHQLWYPTSPDGWITMWAEEPKPERRQHIRGAIREAVYRRDGYACVVCGSTERLTLDHVIHWSLGGPDTVDNLRTLCHSCNCSRGLKTDAEWLGVSA